ncbi:MAG: aldo/keto reductase [Actinomycetota bacterium]
MQYVRLGGTGVRVSPLCLGAMMFGGWGEPDHGNGIETIHAALDAGINFIDTANVYSEGESERIVGKALKGRRDGVVLATKLYGAMSEDPNDRGTSRRHIIQEVENSLRRLDTDYIDLYQVHRPDPLTDLSETLGALDDLVRQGKVRYIGSSTFPPDEVVEAQWAASRDGLQRFVSEQPPYSIFVRHVEEALLPVAQRYRMGVLAWSPLAGGWLSGRFRKGRPYDQTGRAKRSPERFDPSKPENQRKYDIIEQLVPLAQEEGISLVELGVSWVLEHPAVTSAIIGPRNRRQLEGQLKAGDICLSTETLDAVDEIVPPGVTLNKADEGYMPPWLDVRYRRRRRDLS